VTTPDSSHDTVRDVPSPAGGSIAITLAGICVLGLVVRLLHWSALVQTSWPQHPLAYTEADTFAFYAWAQTILAGDWMGWNTFHPYFEWMRRMAPLEVWYQWWGGKEIFHQAPLYPYVLAVFMGLCGGSLSCVLLIQLLIGAIQPLIMYALVKRTFCPVAGFVAAGFTALYGPLVFHQGVILRDWLPPILEPLALLFVLRATAENCKRDWVMAGIFLGLAILTRETAMILIPVVLAWTIYVSRNSLPLVMTRTGWLAMGLTLSLLPLAGRNLAVGAPLFSISTRSAETVIMANTSGPLETMLPTLLDQSKGDPLSALRNSIATHQGDWTKQFRILLWKTEILKDVFEYPNNVSIYYGTYVSPILRWLPGYGWLFPLGLAGVLLRANRSRDHGLYLLYGAATLTWLLIIAAVSRYRLTFVPFLIIYAAGLIAHLLEKVRAHDWQAAAVRATAFIVAAVILQRAVLTLPDTAKDYTYLPDYLAAARTYAERKQYARAADEIRSLIAKNQALPTPRQIPSFVLTDYQLFQAHEFLQRGQEVEARQALEKAVETFAEPVQESEAPMSYPLFNFALLYIKLDEPAQARQALDRFIRLDPANPLAGKAKKLLAQLGEGAEAASAGE